MIDSGEASSSEAHWAPTATVAASHSHSSGARPLLSRMSRSLSSLTRQRAEPVLEREFVCAFHNLGPNSGCDSTVRKVNRYHQ